MRYGRKSSAGKFNGYKTHITKDVALDVITSVDVSPANCPDGKMAEPLIKEAEEEFDIKTKSLCGNGAYGSGKMRKDMVEKRELMTSAELYSLIERGSLDIGETFVVIPKWVFRGSIPGTYRLSLVAWCDSEGRYTIPIRMVQTAR